MRRAAIRALTLLVVAAAVALPSATTVSARDKKTEGPVFRYPTDIDENQLRILLQSSEDPATIVFEKGSYAFSPQLFVFNRANVTICGATGNAKDVSIQSDGQGSGAGRAAAILVEQASNVTIRDLTIVATAEPTASDPNLVNQGIRLNAQLATDFSSYVDGVTVEGCRIEADVPILATASATNLTVTGSTLECGIPNGSCLIWGDGDGLLVTKSKLTTAPGVDALSGIFVQGTGAQFSDGERAASVILTRNKITGDFVRGFDLADVTACRVRRNRFRFPGASSRAFGGVITGRVGVLVRRGAASSLPSDYEVTKNSVRNAFYGAWILNGGQGVVSRNDFRRCGSSRADQFFNEFGGGIRLTLFSANCLIDIARNNVRNLESPKAANADPRNPSSPIVDVPAIVVVPTELSGACFGEGDRDNKTSNGRVLFLGATD